MTRRKKPPHKASKQFDSELKAGSATDKRTGPKDRRGDEISMDDIAYKIEVKAGTKEERRGKMPKANELANNEILGTKQHWDEARDYPKIIQAVQANQTDYDACVGALNGLGLKSRAWKTATTNDQGKFTVYQSSPFTEDQVISKARTVVKKLNDIGVDISFPKKQARVAFDYKAMAVNLGLLKSED